MSEATTTATAGPRLAELTTLRVGGPAREVVTATTEDELVAAVLEADGRGAPCCWSAAGPTWSSRDEGFDGRVVLVRTRGADGDAGRLRVAAGEPWDELVAATVAEGRGGVGRAVRDPGPCRGDPDPERRRLRPGDRVGGDGRAGARPGHRGHPRAGAAGLRLRLPRQPVQARPGVRGARGRADPGRRRRRRSGTPSWPARSASRWARPPRRRTCGRRSWAFAGARAWSWTPPTRTPAAPGPSSRTRCWRTPTPAWPRCPARRPRYPAVPGSVKVSAAWLIEQAGFAEGLRARRRTHLDQAHPGPDQPRRGDHRGAAGARRRGGRRRPGQVRHRPRRRAGPGRLRAAGLSRPVRSVRPEPGLDPGQQPGLDVGRRRARPHRAGRQLGERLVGDAVPLAHQLVLVGQPRPRTAAGRRRPAPPAPHRRAACAAAPRRCRRRPRGRRSRPGTPRR